MRILLVAATLAGAAALPASAAEAQPWGYGGYHNPEVRQEMRECRRELRRADSRREYRRELRECRRELRQAQLHSQRYNGYAYRDPYYDRGYRGGYYQDSGRYWDGYRWRYRY